MSFLLRNSIKFLVGKQLLKVYCQRGQLPYQQELHITVVSLIPHQQNPNTTHQNDSTAKQKKHKESIKITLIQNQNLTVTGLEEAKNLAKRRSMHLVKVQDMDTKTQRPVYKLLTAAEMLQFELSDIKTSNKSIAAEKSTAGATKKSEKSLNIGSRIAEHDLTSRIKNISKWLNKQHEVRILIQGSSEQDLGNCEKVFKTIEEAIKTPEVIGRIVQKRSKGSVVKFSILPATPAANEKSSSQ